MLSGLDRVLFRRQSETVVAHGVQYVEPTVPLVTCHDIAGDVSERMPHMQPGTAGVREHIEDIILGLGGVVLHAVGAALAPFILPLLLDLRVFVLHLGRSWPKVEGTEGREATFAAIAFANLRRRTEEWVWIDITRPERALQV